MITSTPKLAQAAARAELEQAKQLTAALRHATEALTSLPLEAALALHEQYATRWPDDFKDGCETLRTIVSTQAAKAAEIAALQAEHRACDEWLRACDTLQGQALLDACGTLAVRYPKRFGQYFETIRQLAKVQRERDEARRFDCRKAGFSPPDFPYHPPARVER